MSLFASSEDLEGELVPALREFLASPAGEQAAAAVAKLETGTVVSMRISDPASVVWADLSDRSAGSGECGEAVAELLIDADSVHHMGMNQLAPVQVAKAIEERRIDANGSFELLLVLLSSLSPLGDFWQNTLAAHGRDDLLTAPAPPEVETYSVETELRRQRHRPPWAGRSKRAVSKSTRRSE